VTNNPPDKRPSARLEEIEAELNSREFPYAYRDSANENLAWLIEHCRNLQKALDLVLYYVEGAATWEALKPQVDQILEGKVTNE